MKTIAIMTLHRVLNYGSVLQAFALCRALESMGHRPYVVDYVTANHQFWKVVFGSKARRAWPARMVLAQASIPRIAVSRIRFDRFIQECLPISSRRYNSIEELRSRPPEADVYMTGSDQVWNTVYNGGVDLSYFLDFGAAYTPRVSYAASFGREELADDEMALTSELVSRYQRIGVREASAVPLMAAMGRDDAVQVVDPTLLLTGPQWLDVAGSVSPSVAGAARSGYVLLHSVNKECLSDLRSCAARIAEHKGLKVVSTFALNANLRGRAFGSTLGWHRNTREFLRLVAGADVVVSDSFHGTVFAILLGRRFVTVLPPKYATRVTSLLSMAGLESRIARLGAGIVPQSLESIDYEAVHARVDRQRRLSLEFLREATELSV